jgi:hypothetical protein
MAQAAKVTPEHIAQHSTALQCWSQLHNGCRS